MLYHGDNDNIVPIENSLMLYNSLKSKGCNAELNILYGYGHNDAIEKVYEEGNITNWLLSQRRERFDYIPEFLEELF